MQTQISNLISTHTRNRNSSGKLLTLSLSLSLSHTYTCTHIPSNSLATPKATPTWLPACSPLLRPLKLNPAAVTDITSFALVRAFRSRPMQDAFRAPETPNSTAFVGSLWSKYCNAGRWDAIAQPRWLRRKKKEGRLAGWLAGALSLPCVSLFSLLSEGSPSPLFGVQKGRKAWAKGDGVWRERIERLCSLPSLSLRCLSQHIHSPFPPSCKGIILLSFLHPTCAYTYFPQLFHLYF
jgi:hypothetical protein